MRNIERFKDKIIILFCYQFNLSLPKRIQKRILNTALLNMHRYCGMCDSLWNSLELSYKLDFSYCPDFTILIPKFNIVNFNLVTNHAIDVVTKYDYWCKSDDKYSRIKFLNWCIKQL